MARIKPRPAATLEWTPRVQHIGCPHCGKATWSAYVSRRTVTTLEGVTALRLHEKNCQAPDCPRYHRPCRPEEGGRIALPPPRPRDGSGTPRRAEEGHRRLHAPREPQRRRLDLHSTRATVAGAIASTPDLSYSLRGVATGTNGPEPTPPTPKGPVSCTTERSSKESGGQNNGRDGESEPGESARETRENSDSRDNTKSWLLGGIGTRDGFKIRRRPLEPPRKTHRRDGTRRLLVQCLYRRPPFVLRRGCRPAGDRRRLAGPAGARPGDDRQPRKAVDNARNTKPHVLSGRSIAVSG